VGLVEIFLKPSEFGPKPRGVYPTFYGSLRFVHTYPLTINKPKQKAIKIPKQIKSNNIKLILESNKNAFH